MDAKEMVSGAVKNIQGKLTVITPEIKAMVERRWNHCQRCPHRGIVTLPVIKTKHDGCTICGCPFAEKLVLKTEQCPRKPPFWLAE